MYVQVRDGILILFIVTKVFFGCRGRDLQCRQVKFTQVKSRVILVQVKSSQESQKLVTGVRLESTINAVIEGIHVHRSVKLFLVLLRLAGASWGPAKFVHGTYPACEALAVSPQNPRGDSWGPVPASQFTRGAPFCTRGGLELLHVVLMLINMLRLEIIWLYRSIFARCD